MGIHVAMRKLWQAEDSREIVSGLLFYVVTVSKSELVVYV